jgi:hypothetical protein
MDTFQLDVFDLFGIVFVTMFGLGLLVFAGLFGLVALNMWRFYSKQQAMPIESKPATVVAMRTMTSGGGGSFSVSTNCYATFEFEDGERLELAMDSKQYGLVVEGDTGTVVYQGARCKDFIRTTDEDNAAEAGSPARIEADARSQVPDDDF